MATIQMQRKWGIVPALVLLALSSVPASLAQGGEIRLLLIGDVTLGESPIQEWLRDDPAMRFEIIPCNVENIPVEDQYKAARIYTPRTEEDFAARFDAMVMLDTNLYFFDDTQIHRFYVMVENYGIGIFHAPNQRKGSAVYDGFANTEMGQVFPHDYSTDFNWPIEKSYTIVLNRNPELEPVLTTFLDYGIEGVRGAKYGKLVARAGSITWATMVPQDQPWQISWEYGEKNARTWCTAEDVDDPWWNVISNPYGTDVFLNIVLYINRRKLPENIPMIHQLRNQFKEYRTRRGLIYGILDFADKFGANPSKIDLAVVEVDKVRDDAFDSYVNQEYVQALDHMNTALQRMSEIEQDAMRLKDRALFWIYIVEWLTVTGTSILAGSLIWALMVKRKLYKEVVTTRTAEG